MHEIFLQVSGYTDARENSDSRQGQKAVRICASDESGLRDNKLVYSNPNKKPGVARIYTSVSLYTRDF